MSEMLTEMPPEQMWTLSEDGETVRRQLPPLPIAGIPEPLRIHLDFDAEMVDEIVQHLAVLRTQMLPPPQRTRVKTQWSVLLYFCFRTDIGRAGQFIKKEGTYADIRDAAERRSGIGASAHFRAAPNWSRILNEAQVRRFAFRDWSDQRANDAAVKL